MQIGDRVRFQTTSSDRSVITYSAEVVKITETTYTVRVPERVRHLPFPPMGKNPETGLGFKFLTYRRSL